MKKRLISILLTLVMVLSCVSVAALADTEGEEAGIVPITEDIEPIQDADSPVPIIEDVEERPFLGSPDSVSPYGLVEFDEDYTYQEFLDMHREAESGTTTTVIDYSNLSGQEGSVEVRPAAAFQSEGDERFEFDNVVFTGEDGSATFEFTMEQGGLYNIIVNYHTYEGKNIAAVRRILINGEVPYRNVTETTFPRRFVDALEEREDGTRGFRQDYFGNDIRPDQMEVFSWQSTRVVDFLGHVIDPLKFHFNEGTNTITLSAVNEPLVIGSIQIVPIIDVPTYAEYRASIGEAPEFDGEEVFIEAELATHKSAKTLHPSVDVSSASTSSVDGYASAFTQSVNVMGGTNWQYAQQSITWTVPADTVAGLYAINFKYRQNTADGMLSPRRLFVNGEVPFQEALALRFRFTTRWNMLTLTTGEGDDAAPALIYLNPGDEITLETTLGGMGQFISHANEILNGLNEVYRQIIRITGVHPDPNRDYQLDTIIPREIERLGYYAEALQRVHDDVIEYTGDRGSGVAMLGTLIHQARRLADDPGLIGRQLIYFQTNVGSLGNWINTASHVPLELDYISLSAPGTPIRRAERGFFRGMVYNVSRFISSFVIDFNAIGNTARVDPDDDDTITVWLTTGRDQFEILRQLINNSYTAETGNQINLELVDPGALLTAVVAGIGPDVVLDQPATAPVNYALRNAIVDLNEFRNDPGTPGSSWNLPFDEVLAQFHPTMLRPFFFDRAGLGRPEDTGLYALPERQDFQVMFYRRDVLAAEQIPIPRTWTELISTITALHKQNLEFGMPAPNVITAMPIFYSILRQLGGSLFTEDYTSTDLRTPEATRAFRQWTNFYVNYDLPLEYNFQNRFRTGQMPLGIGSFTLYNTLAVAAPEIRGRWGYTLIPGTERTRVNAAGEEVAFIDHSSQLGVSGIFMLNRNRNRDLSWQFMKWWVSSTAQSAFGNNMESVLGPAARYNTANMYSFDQLPWSVSERAILNEQMTWGEAPPQIAGSYFIDRHITNAFRRVIFQQTDPRDTLFDYSNTIDVEIMRRRQEFDLPNTEEEFTARREELGALAAELE